MKKTTVIYRAAGELLPHGRFLFQIFIIGDIRNLEPAGEAAAADLGQNHAVVGIGGMDDLTVPDIYPDVTLMPESQTRRFGERIDRAFLRCIFVHGVRTDIGHTVCTVCDTAVFTVVPAVVLNQSDAVRSPSAEPVCLDKVCLAADLIGVLLGFRVQRFLSKHLTVGSPYNVLLQYFFVVEWLVDGIEQGELAERPGENGRKAYEYTLEKSNGEEAGIRPAFLACYTYGLAGSPMENVPEEFKSALSGDAAYRAWASGQNDAAASLRNDQEKVKFASLAGEDSGLVYDDFVNEAVRSGRSRVDVNEENRTYLSAETAEQINETAKALGLRVQFADSVRGGTANAQISGDTILIEKDNPNPVLAIAGHEFGHRLQELAPEEYRRFRESVLEGREQEVRDKAAQYAKLGVNFTYEEAMNEVANDQAGLLMDGGEVLDRFIEQHRSDRTLLQKMRDAIRSFIDKVTGKERKRLETAEGKLEAALKAAAKEAKALQKKSAGDTMGAGKYSLKEDGVDGREEADRNGEIRQQTDRSRTEERRQGTNRKGETGDQEAGRVHDDNGKRHGGLNPSLALQDKAGRDTMGAGKYSLKEDGVGGRENETGRRSEAGGQEGHEETSDREGEERNRRVRREFSASSGRYEGVDPSFGEKPFRTWTEGYVIMPSEGTVSYVEQQTVKEYGVPSFVVSDAAWGRGETKAPAFSVHGQIYLQETIPEKFRGMIAPHEITYVMRQVEFAPYLDFVERTPTMLDMGSAFTQKLLEHTANHQHTTVMDADPVRLYDEFNATLYDHIHSGKMGNLVEPLSHVFYDFDAYAKELTELHQWFKAAREAKALQKKAAGDTMGAGKYSLKEDGVGGREESRTGRIDTEIVENRTGAGREFEQKGREGNSGNGGKLAVSDRRRTQRIDPSFGERPYRTWTEGHIIEPTSGTVAYEEQQTAARYGVPSFVVSDKAWEKSGVDAPAFSVHGQIYFRETIPESYRGMVAPHEVTHVMRQVEFAPYLDFVERTSTMLNMNDDYTTLVLEHIAALRGQTLDTIDPSILYDEFNAMMYGSIAVGNTNIFQNGKGSGMFHDFDAYAKELTELHQRFKAERETKALQDKAGRDTMGAGKYSLKEDENSDIVSRNQTESEGAGTFRGTSAQTDQASDTGRSRQNRQGVGSEVRSEVGSTVRREEFLREHRERGNRSVRLKGDYLYAYHEATPLYAVGGKKAAEQYAKFRIWMEGIKNETDGNRTSFDRWNGSIQSAPWNQRTNLSDTGRRETVSGHDSLYAGASEGNRGGTPGTGAENRRVNSKFSLKAPVEETRDLVAASAPTEYAESGRWQSAAEQAKSLQDKAASDTIGSDYWPGGKVEYSYDNLYQAVRNGDSASVETIRKALEASGKDPKSVDSAVKSRLRADLKEAFWDSESLNDSQVRELSRLLAQWDPEADPEDYLEKTVKKKWKEAYQGGKGEYSEYRKYYDILKKTFGYSNDEIIRMGKDK